MRLILTDDPTWWLRRRPDLEVYSAPDMALPIPEWPDAGTREGIVFAGYAPVIAVARKAHGVGIAFALGMLAQTEAESGLDPKAVGDHN